MFVFSRLDDSVSAPPLAPLASPIDREHLHRMTLGERDLEREVLALFDRQADMMLARMRSNAPDIAAAAAHTLKGSARGVGAWRVASAAEAVELASSSPAAYRQAVATLGTAITETKTAIAEMLRSN